MDFFEEIVLTFVTNLSVTMIDACSQATNCAIINIGEKMLILIIVAICLGRQFGIRTQTTSSSTFDSQSNQPVTESEGLLMDFFEEIVHNIRD